MREYNRRRVPLLSVPFFSSVLICGNLGFAFQVPLDITLRPWPTSPLEDTPLLLFWSGNSSGKKNKSIFGSPSFHRGWGEDDGHWPKTNRVHSDRCDRPVCLSPLTRGRDWRSSVPSQTNHEFVVCLLHERCSVLECEDEPAVRKCVRTALRDMYKHDRWPYYLRNMSHRNPQTILFTSRCRLWSV